MSNKFFTADLHFGHQKIFKERGFTSIEEMDEKLIYNWNSLIDNKDEVYILGDFSFHKKRKTVEIVKRLNGNKCLILGNHDKKNLNNEIKSYFNWCKDYHEQKIDNEFVVMSHYPMLTWNKSHYGSFMLHGHSHGSLQANHKIAKRLDVGVDVNFKFYDLFLKVHKDKFFPFSWEEIKKIMDKKIFKKEDCHSFKKKEEKNSNLKLLFKNLTNELTKVFELENGYCVYVRINDAGGIEYITDEIGGGVIVWNTTISNPKTIEQCLLFHSKNFGNY